MPLDSDRVKDKRERAPAKLGTTPREIMKRCPDINLICGYFEDIATDARFDVVVMHNVTEHLHQIRDIIPGLRDLMTPNSKLIYHHHNFYCWNGHHLAPSRPDQYVPGNEKHDAVADWRHILIAEDLPEDHYIKTGLNRIRLDEIRQLTYDSYDVVIWREVESPSDVADRLSDEVIERIAAHDPELGRRDLMVNAVLCVARLPRQSDT